MPVNPSKKPSAPADSSARPVLRAPAKPAKPAKPVQSASARGGKPADRDRSDARGERGARPQRERDERPRASGFGRPDQGRPARDASRNDGDRRSGGFSQRDERRPRVERDDRRQGDAGERRFGSPDRGFRPYGEPQGGERAPRASRPSQDRAPRSDFRRDDERRPRVERDDRRQGDAGERRFGSPDRGYRPYGEPQGGERAPRASRPPQDRAPRSDFRRDDERPQGRGFGRSDERRGNDRYSSDRRDDRSAEPEKRHIPGSFVSEATRRPTTGIRTYRPAADGSDRAIPVKRAPESEVRQDDRPGAVRINKRIADMGLCSRREADEWVENGWVRVNGEVAVMGQNVVPGDRIEVDQKAQERQEQQVTILLHKPMGYVSGQAEDGHEPAVVLLKPENHWNQDRSKTRFNFSQLKGLAPCGRLDIDSVGLLVLTQDGRVARHIIGEDSEVDKEYLVRVSYGERDVDVQSVFPEEQLALLRHGLELDGEALKPAQVDWQNPEQLRFVLTEGKKRQIRRMCELVGLRVVGLKRIRIGRVTLGNLPVGQWRYLAPYEQF